MDSELIKLLTEMAQEQSNGDELDDSSGLRMPRYLKEQIITRTTQPDMQITAAPRRISKRLELFIYSCKVTAAVAACLVMMITFSATQNHFPSLPEQTESLLEADFAENALNSIIDQLNDGSQNITSWLQNFSGDIMKMMN
ncbi:MAG: hypothetical protein NC124_06135 [Clostridium sp.]|nr:hypothetical protein [Clostridium sp.]